MPSANKLTQLKRQREQLSARIQKLEAPEKTKERKADTRRKILIGAYYLDKARSEHTLDNLNQLMDGYLTREIDKALFEFEKPK